MARDGSVTREKIIDAALKLALKQGHVATSVDEVISKAGITKGTFFYHFPTKKDLAAALIKTFSDVEMQVLEENMTKAVKLSRDPLQQLLIFVGLIQDMHEQRDSEYIGCLFASYSYENQLVDKALLSMATTTLTEWKQELGKLIRKIIALYPPSYEVNPDDLANMFLVTMQGAYVLKRVTGQPDVIQLHLEQYKTYLESLFRPQQSQHSGL